MLPHLVGQAAILNRWELGRVLGAGGNGVVYEAFDRERGARVAIKELRRLDAASIYRFKQEFRSLADIVHPNLVALHELFFAAGSWFFTMDLVAGVTFHQWVRPELDLATAETVDINDVFGQGPSASGPLPRAPRGPGPLDVPRLLAALEQLATGVCALHDAGKLHRDLKPSNVLVTHDGLVVILDFGLVADTRTLSSERGEIAGTPEYMSPEQAAGAPLDAASDWYAFGVMLFEALTGRPPQTGSMMEILSAKQTGPEPDPRRLVPGLPEDLASLCADLLRVDPGRRPSGREVLRRLGREVPPSFSLESLKPSERVPQRENQLRALHEAHERARSELCVVHVHGASGMGKSTLIRRFLDEVSCDPAAILLEGRCYARESVPYNAFDSLIDALTEWLLAREDAAALMPRDAQALARVFPVLRRVPAIFAARGRVGEAPDGQELRRRAFGALRELLLRMSEIGRLALFIDDLQWADDDSLALFRELVRPPDGPPMMVLFAHREAEPPALGVPVQSIALGPLEHAEARALATVLLGDVSRTGDKADVIARESGGSPFFIAELVRFVRDGGDADVDVSLERVLGERLSRLPPGARSMLELLAVAGAPLPLAVLRESTSDPHQALGVLRASHFVRRAATHDLEIFHARIRDALLPLLDGPAVHRALAESLAKHDGDPEMLADHFAAAGDRERAWTYAVRAAERAASALAFDRAVALYRRAIALRPDERRSEIHANLGDALVDAGRGTEAAEAYLIAVEGSAPARAFELRRRAGEQLLRSGRVDEGITVLRSVLADAGVTLPESPRRALLHLVWTRLRLRLRGTSFREGASTELRLQRVDACWSAACGLSMVSVIRGADFQARHLLLALDAGEPFRLARAFAMEASLVAVGGARTAPKCEALLAAAEPLARRVDKPHATAWVDGAAGAVAYFHGRYRDALAIFERTERTLRDHCTGTAWDLTTAHLFALGSLFYLGDVGELARRMPGLLAEARGRGDLYAEVNLRTAYGNLAWLVEDDPERAHTEAIEATGRWSKRGFLLQHWYELRSRCFIELYRGAAVEGYAHLREQWPRLMSSLLANAQHTLLEAHLLRARLALAASGERRDAALLRDAARSVARVARERAANGDAQALLVRAAIAAQRGDDPISLLEEAVAACERVELGLFALAARARIAEWTNDANLRRVVTAELASRGVRAPDRWIEMLAPGFPPPRRLGARHPSQ